MQAEPGGQRGLPGLCALHHQVAAAGLVCGSGGVSARASGAGLGGERTRCRQCTKGCEQRTNVNRGPSGGRENSTASTRASQLQQQPPHH